MQPSQPLHKYLDSCRNQPCIVDSKDHFLQRNMCSMAPVKRIQHFTNQRLTFANHSSALLSAAQFRVVKWTKHFGQHFLSFFGAFAVLHKNWNKKMPCEDWACAILMTLSTFLIAIKQGRAAPSGTEQYRAAPSSTEQDSTNGQTNTTFHRSGMLSAARWNVVFVWPGPMKSDKYYDFFVSDTY